MQQPIDDVAQWDLIRMQISQSLVEHEIVTQALRAQAIVATMFILGFGCLSFFLWRSRASLNEAFHAEISRNSFERCELVRKHSTERVSMLKEQSLQLASMQMQMLHAFEGMASRAHASSGSLPGSEPATKRTPKPGL